MSSATRSDRSLTTTSNIESTTQMIRFIVPLILAAIAITLGVTGFLLLPSEQELRTPRPVTVAVLSQEQPSVVTYAVTHLHGSDYHLSVGVGIFANPPHAVVNTLVAIQVTLPVGVVTDPCLRPECSAAAGIYVLSRQRRFTSSSLREFTIPITAREFGYTANGTDASVVMPEVFYTGPGTPKLVVHYKLPSASGYDWASFPAVYTSPGRSDVV